MPGFTGTRLVVLVLGTVILAVGLVFLLVGRGGLAVVGVWTTVAGGAMVVGSLLERVRYRSESADRIGAPPGPGGGEPLEAPLDPRFQRTDEVFADPTSGHRMRVWIDRTSGERRYRVDDRPVDRMA